MTCAFCGYEFCYLCGGDAAEGSGHWNPLVGCGVGMMQQVSGPRSLACRILIKIGCILAALILGPLVIVLGPPIGMSVLWVAVFGKINPVLGACCCLLFPIPFAIGLIIDICWIPVAILAIPIGLIAFTINRIKSNRDNKRKAMERVNEIIEKKRRLFNQR